jgi:uncharacterized OB-fold protein
VNDDLLRPALTAENAPFWEGVQRGELRIQQCPETGRLIFPPRLRSPWAPHATEPPRWIRVSGRGRIWSFAVPHPPLLPWYAARAPYNVILVALDEDPTIRLVGNLVASEAGDIDEIDPATIAIGAEVRVVFAQVDADLRLPRWRLVR